MNVMVALRDKFRPPKYNPEHDASVQQRNEIAERTERVIRLTDEIHRRIDVGRFPILLDERVDRHG